MMGQPKFLYPNAPYLSIATVTATDSYAGIDPNDVLQAQEGTYWRPLNTSGTKTLTIDLKVARDFDSIGLVGEGLDGVVVTVVGDDNSGFASPETLVDAANLSAPVNCGWQQFPSPVSYRYGRISFSNFGSDFRVAFASLQNSNVFPYLEEDWDGSSIADGGKAIVSPAGNFMGFLQQKSMRQLPIRFGDVTQAEYASFAAWSRQCVATARPFIFVPDTDLAESHFGWTESKFSAPISGGMHRIGNISFVTRAK